MRICIVGGVFSKNDFLKNEMQSAPERVLEVGLRKLGHTVVTCSINDDPPSDCDVVHCHHFGYATLQASIGRTPFVFTSHNPFIASHYMTLSLPCYTFVGRVVMARADAIIALSNIERKVFLSSLGASDKKIHVIHNGLIRDIYDSPSTESQSRKRELRLLCVAQLQKFKGIDYLLEATRIVAKRHPALRLEIVTNNKRLLPKYTRMCKELGIMERVEFNGPLTMHDLVESYHRCTIYVHPSLAEDLPTSISEAMMCGKPIVAARVGGIPEQVFSDAGILVRPRDHMALANAIFRLIEDPESASRMGTRAREVALERFDHREMCAKHSAVYDEVVRGRGYSRKSKSLEGAMYRHAMRMLDIVKSRQRRE